MNENKQFKVYKHVSPIGKVYIGITSQTVEKRWQNGYGYKQNSYFYSAIKKYGWENITHEILAEGLTKEEAYDAEKSLIKQYKSNDRNYGYNCTKGGEGGNGYVMSEETRQKIRELSLGRHLSEEAKKKVSEFHKGRKRSEETKRKISEALKRKTEHKGHPISDDVKKKLSLAHTGKKNPHVGIPRSEETRKKISLARKGSDNYFKRAVMCIETGTMYMSIKEAATKNNVDARNISRSLKKPNRKTAGLSWKYCDGR